MDLHGKLLVGIGSNDEFGLLYLGSSNFTASGLGLGHLLPGPNVEAGVLVSVVGKSNVVWLKESARRLLAGSWSSLPKVSWASGVLEPDAPAEDPRKQDRFRRLFLSSLKPRRPERIIEFPTRLAFERRSVEITEVQLTKRGRVIDTWRQGRRTSRRSTGRFHWPTWDESVRLLLKLEGSSLNEVDLFPPDLLGDDWQAGEGTITIDELLAGIDASSRWEWMRPRKRRGKRHRDGMVFGVEDARFPWHTLKEFRRRLRTDPDFKRDANRVAQESLDGRGLRAAVQRTVIQVLLREAR